MSLRKQSLQASIEYLDKIIVLLNRAEGSALYSQFNKRITKQAENVKIIKKNIEEIIKDIKD